MLARIYRPSKTAMQSGRAKAADWVLEFEPKDARRPDPLMGWTVTSDTESSQVRLTFETKEEAVRYAEAHRIAFQLIDDALDYSAKQEALGKTVGDDFREGKITLPVILAFLRGGAEERTFWQRVMEAQEQAPEDLQEAIRLMTRHGALKDTVARAAHYGAMAKDALGIFKESAEKRALTEVVDYCIQRGH